MSNTVFRDLSANDKTMDGADPQVAFGSQQFSPKTMSHNCRNPERWTANGL